jgi:NAD(P)-dependent dehydrogenase (short-subunit alcohol dehydrogenase family)
LLDISNEFLRLITRRNCLKTLHFFWGLQMSNEQAYDPSPDLYDYAQTKAATMNYIKSLAKQLAPRRIRVNGVAPGPIWTPLQVSGGATQEKLKHFGGNTPMGRPGQPAELASIYVQLAASDASYATGQVYGSSGGAGQP